jgi:hypothetical protein
MRYSTTLPTCAKGVIAAIRSANPTKLVNKGTDIHQHLWPDAFRRALERRAEPPYLRGRVLTLPRGGTFEVDPDAYGPEARLRELDAHGLERAVVSLPPTSEPTAGLSELWQEEALVVERESRGRLLPLAYRCADRRFVGAIVSAAVLGQGVVLPQLERNGQFAFVHPDAVVPEARGWHAAGVGYTQQLLNAYAWWLAEGTERHPRLRIAFALLGGGAAFHVERFVRRGLDPRAPFTTNTWFETSSYGSLALELSLQTFGPARLVFGSDAPVDAVGEAHAAAASFGPALEDELLVGSPHALLSRDVDLCAA